MGDQQYVGRPFVLSLIKKKFVSSIFFHIFVESEHTNTNAKSDRYETNFNPTNTRLDGYSPLGTTLD